MRFMATPKDIWLFRLRGFPCWLCQFGQPSILTSRVFLPHQAKRYGGGLLLKKLKKSNNNSMQGRKNSRRSQKVDFKNKPQTVTINASQQVLFKKD
jgi:hypothetical protein